MEFTSRAGGLRFIVSMCLAASFCRKKQREQGTRKAKYPENDNKFLACARDNKSSGSADGLFLPNYRFQRLRSAADCCMIYKIGN